MSWRRGLFGTAPSPASTVDEMTPVPKIVIGLPVLAAQLRIALFTLRRPPVTVTPARLARGSTFASSVDFRAAVVRLQADNTNIAAPETCGVAMEVPLREAYEELGQVERIPTPGAPK